jgi:hypothetical protein
MTKGKNKRKRQRAHQQTHQKPLPTSALDRAINCHSEAPTGATREDETHNKKERLVRFRELMKSSTLTNWCLVIFTGILAGAAIYQFIIMGSQLDTMRKDARPWIKIDFDPITFRVNSPIGSTVHIVDNGKTPAKAITVDVVVEKVNNGEEPKLDYHWPHSRFTTGLLSPNTPRDAPFSRLRASANGTATEDDILTQSESDDFQHFKIFFVVYAITSYKDFFGIEHWTKLCVAELPPNVSGTFTGKKCTNYGDVDSN